MRIALGGVFNSGILATGVRGVAVPRFNYAAAPAAWVERVARILDDAPNARVETIRDRILEEGEVTKRQAALIARDQVLSLNAQVAQARHEAAGITQYIWRTSGDGDVRPDHKALNGKAFSYDEPPVVNASEVRRGRAERREHPGQDYQCRCTAEPVIPGFDETPPARA